VPLVLVGPEYALHEYNRDRYYDFAEGLRQLVGPPAFCTKTHARCTVVMSETGGQRSLTITGVDQRTARAIAGHILDPNVPGGSETVEGAENYRYSGNRRNDPPQQPKD